MKKVLLLFLLFSLSSAAVFGDEREPVALVLSGGGARGAYEIGVWKALIDMDVEIGCVYGVSVGAINGAVIAMNDFETAKRLWLRLENDNVMELTAPVRNLITGNFSFSDLLEAAGELIESGGINVSPLEKLLGQYVDEKAIRENGIEYGLVAYSVSDMTEKFFYIEDIPEGKLVDYILASANFPLFQRKLIGEEEFIDGGIYKNLVIEMVDSKKYSSAILVSLDIYMPADIIDYLTDYSGYELDVKFLNPSIDTGSALDFQPEKSRRLMRMGYLDCMRFYGCISGERYSIAGKDLLFKMYRSLSAVERAEAAELLELGGLPAYVDFSDIRSWDDYFVPVLRRAAASDSLLLERYALRYGLERYRLYTEDEMIRTIVRKYISRPNSGLFYDPVLDFISYLALKADMKFEPDENCAMVIAGYNSFQE